eukprot:UN10056
MQPGCLHEETALTELKTLLQDTCRKQPTLQGPPFQGLGFKKTCPTRLCVTPRAPHKIQNPRLCDGCEA